jgi:hypothetical protein
VTQQLRDRYGKLIGTIETKSDGRLEVHDYTGRRLGSYDPKKDRTYDRYDSLVGEGNLLTTLL